MGTVGGADHHPHSPRLLSIPKEGERILAPTRRPDGTLRKQVRIRAGYFPQDEVAIYQSKGALLMKEAKLEYPPGYDPAPEGKAKTKSAKRNERKKEKKHQATLASSAEKGINMDPEQAEKMKTPQATVRRLESVESVTDQIHSLSITPTVEVPGPSKDSRESSMPGDSGPDLEKRIRALKKKIRLADAQVKGDQQHTKAEQTEEQTEKMARVDGWREELKLLEDGKAKMFF